VVRWATIVLATVTPVAALAELPHVPVRPGGDPSVRACPRSAAVDTTAAPQTSTLNVRSGPDKGYAVIDQVKHRTRLLVCDRRQGGRWIGVVYGGSPQQCGVAMRTGRQWPYTGPCRVGWVMARWVTFG